MWNVDCKAGCSRREEVPLTNGRKKQLVGYDDADYQPTVTDCKGVIIQLKIIIQYSILTIQ